MKRRTIIAVIDRIEGRSVVLEVDGLGERVVPRSALPVAAEGAVLRVELVADGEPDWATAVRDHAEETRRREVLGERANRLRRHDVGGDMDL